LAINKNAAGDKEENVSGTKGNKIGGLPESKPQRGFNTLPFYRENNIYLMKLQ